MTKGVGVGVGVEGGVGRGGGRHSPVEAWVEGGGRVGWVGGGGGGGGGDDRIVLLCTNRKYHLSSHAVL